MNASARAGRRGQVAAQLGLSDRVFAGAGVRDRKLANTIDAGLESVETALLDEIRFADEIANVTTRYLLKAGGKRVRPMLTLLAAELGDGALPEVVTAASAIEITHLASLYHDDVMDDADKRRGVPSSHTVWGNSVAILAGDLLFARASQLMARLGERAITLQADTFERLVLGQLHETVGPQPGEDPIAHYHQVLADKTGSLIAAAAQMGVAFSNADPALEQPLMQFGEKAGVVFQLVDDVIDLSPQPEETGKSPGTDLRAGVATLPLLKLRRRAETETSAAALVERIEQDVIVPGLVEPAAAVSSRAMEAIEALRQHDVTGETLQEARELADEAVQALAPVPTGPVKSALTRFAMALVDRSH